MKKHIKIANFIFLLFGVCLTYQISIQQASIGRFVTWPFARKGVYSESPLGNPRELKTTISDNLADNETRCRALFSMFAQHVRYGMSAAEFSGVISDMSWIDSSYVDIIVVEGGGSFLKGGSRCSHIAIFPFGRNGLKRWSIHLCLEGQGNVLDAVNFLKNQNKSPFIAIKNFSLVYPKPGYNKIEEFYWWGMTRDP